MILRAPTGSYLSVLPKGPEDPASVIYTISNNDPPRSSADFLKIPDGIKKKLRDSRIFSKFERRLNLGDLVFTTKSSSQAKVTGGTKIFSYGQVLDFNTAEPTTINAVPAARTITTKHNSNYVDKSSLGLAASEVETLDDEAIVAQDLILGTIETLQKRRLVVEADIINLQKSISEVKKVIGGVDAIILTGSTPDMVQIKNKLIAKQLVSQAQLEAAILELESIPASIKIQLDALNALTELVK